MDSRFALTVHAAGETRDSTGQVVDRPAGTSTVEVSAEQLRAFTDDELRAAGLDDATIAQIRSTP